MKKETNKEEVVATIKPIVEPVVIQEAVYKPEEEIPTKLEHFPIYNK